MSSTASQSPPDGSDGDDQAASYATDAIPSGIEGAQFLADPVSDQLLRVVMELGAALWVERRRTRTLERVLVSTGAIPSDAVEQWVDDPADTAADREELDRWMKNIYGTLAQIRPAGPPTGDSA